jgi:hypothetical protein
MVMLGMPTRTGIKVNNDGQKPSLRGGAIVVLVVFVEGHANDV